LVWINFDRHALMNLFNKARGKFVADVDEIRPQYQDSNLADGAAIFNSSLVRSVGPSIGATIDQLDALTLTEVGSLNELATPWYADQRYRPGIPIRFAFPPPSPFTPALTCSTQLKAPKSQLVTTPVHWLISRELRNRPKTGEKNTLTAPPGGRRAAISSKICPLPNLRRTPFSRGAGKCFRDEREQSHDLQCPKILLIRRC
jgi:hypothetical protein